jgi:hypothetical protein
VSIGQALRAGIPRRPGWRAIHVVHVSKGASWVLGITQAKL